MFTVTRYCVQPYLRVAGMLAPGEGMQFRERDDALRAGAIIRRRVAGVGVYAVTGEPVFDLWREPQLVASFGEVPD